MKNHITILLLLIGHLLYAQNEYQSIDSLFASLNDSNEFNGIVLIGDKDSILFTNSYGYANFGRKATIDLNTQFYIASISKQFTAAAILILSQEKKLTLNDPVNKYISSFKFDDVTIHHLLSNTSGLPGYIDFFATDWNERKQATTDDVVDYLLQIDTLNFKPGDQFQYSNSNFVLLAKIIEIVSQASFPAFLNKHIFEPSQMTNTYSSYKPYFNEMDKNAALGYVIQEDSIVKNESGKAAYINRVNYLSGIQGDGSVVSTIMDLYKWHKVLMGDKLLDEKTKKLLFRPNQLNDGNKSDYGYGWYLNGDLVDHTGSWPGYQTRIIRNLNNGKVGITFKNVETYNWNWVGIFDGKISK